MSFNPSEVCDLFFTEDLMAIKPYNANLDTFCGYLVVLVMFVSEDNLPILQSQASSDLYKTNKSSYFSFFFYIEHETNSLEGKQNILVFNTNRHTWRRNHRLSSSNSNITAQQLVRVRLATEHHSLPTQRVFLKICLPQLCHGQELSYIDPFIRLFLVYRWCLRSLLQTHFTVPISIISFYHRYLTHAVCIREM